MEQGDASAVLRRKLAARKSSSDIAPMTPVKAIQQSLPKAAETSMGLGLAPTDIAEDRRALSPMIETLDTKGLYQILEGPGQAMGFVHLDDALLNAIVQMQTMGRIEGTDPEERAATVTDAALTGEFIDTFLLGFALALQGLSDHRWATGYFVGRRVGGVRHLAMTLEDIPFRLFTISVDIENGTKIGRLQFCLPAEPVDFKEAAPKSGSLEKDLRGMVAQIPAPVRVAMHKMDLPLKAVRALSVGSVLPISKASLGSATLVTAQGQDLCQVRLGQLNGFRAIRVEPREDTPPRDESPPRKVAPPQAVPEPIPDPAPELIPDVPPVPEPQQSQPSDIPLEEQLVT